MEISKHSSDQELKSGKENESLSRQIATITSG